MSVTEIQNNSRVKLFHPLVIRDTTFRNRIFMSPMCQYSAAEGVFNQWHLVHLGARATGGVGLVITEATAVSPEGRITPSCTGLWNDLQAEALRPIVGFVQSQGAKIGVQLAHAGRKASCHVPWQTGKPIVPPAEGSWQTLGPSATPFGHYPTPKAMTEDDIQKVKNDFVAAIARAAKIGVDVIELHFAHGYLAHQFLSPLSNLRTDKWGGEYDNRIRLPLEIAKASREAWPSKPLFARISASDWVAGGWDLPQSIEFCKRLKAIGIDFIDCSSGGLDHRQNIPLEPGYQVPFAEAIRRETQLLVGAVGLITNPMQAEKILREDQADAVLLARELLRDPHWALRAAHILGAVQAPPPQYERAPY